jgi:hypothetical protein
MYRAWARSASLTRRDTSRSYAPGTFSILVVKPHHRAMNALQKPNKARYIARLRMGEMFGLIY